MRRNLLGLALCVASATPALAQTAVQDLSLAPGAAHSGATRIDPTQNLFSASARAELRGAPAPGRRAAAARRTMYTTVGGVLGAGIGFMVSQVFYSDWDKMTNSTFAQERLTYTLSGAAFGMAAGLVMGGNAGAPADGDGTISLPRARQLSSRELITQEEVEDAGGSTALEIIQTLRPNWLITRGTQNARESAQIAGGDQGVRVTAAADATIIVYLDQAKLGGLETLRQIAAGSIRSVQRLSAAEANYRWGAGHTHGAILIESAGQAGSRPDQIR